MEWECVLYVGCLWYIFILYMFNKEFNLNIRWDELLIYVEIFKDFESKMWSDLLVVKLIKGKVGMVSLNNDEM